MNDAVRAELDQYEQRLRQAAAYPGDIRAQALPVACTQAMAVLATLVHLGLLTRDEDAAWRRSLETVVGDGLRLQTFRISAAGAPERDESDEDRARYAYGVCRGSSLTHLAWTLHTAADEQAVAEVLAERADDPARIRRACALGFEDNGRDSVPLRDL